MSRSVVIMAGGKASRWSDYGGTAKHTIAPEGEKLLDRVVRQIKRHGDRPTVMFKSEERYGELDKVYGGHSYWSADGRTVILFGDVWFTDEALDTVMTYTDEAFTVFGRFGASRRTGKPYGELYAVSFGPSEWERIVAAIERILSLDVNPNLWALYRAMHDVPDEAMAEHIDVGDGLVVIDDWTEDFDWPHDLDRWLVNRRRAGFGW